MVSSDTEMPNSSCTRMIRSQARHRTTPWTAGIGHSSTIGKKRPVRGIELGRNARRRNVDETVRSLIIEPVHPVPQRLPIHPADLCRIGPRGSFEHRRNRQQPSRLRDVLRLFCKPAHLAGRVVRPHRNSLAHGNPLGCHLESQRC